MRTIHAVSFLQNRILMFSPPSFPFSSTLQFPFSPLSLLPFPSLLSLPLCFERQGLRSEINHIYESENDYILAQSENLVSDYFVFVITT